MKITHDFHLHTNISLCAKEEATLDLYLAHAKERDLKKIAITDHLWDHAIDGYQGRGGNFYEVQNFEHIAKLRDRISEENKTSDVKILFGAETEYSYQYRRPAISPAVAEQLDVLLVPNSHTHLAMPKDFYEPHEKHIQFMIDAFMDIVNSDVAKYVTAIPHPFMAVCCPYRNRILLDEMTDDQFKFCFDAAANRGIALEINPNYSRNKTLAEAYADPVIRMLRIGKECGCKFTVGTDAHSKPDLENYHLAYLLTSLLELKEDDFHPLTR